MKPFWGRPRPKTSLPPKPPVDREFKVHLREKRLAQLRAEAATENAAIKKPPASEKRTELKVRRKTH